MRKWMTTLFTLLLTVSLLLSCAPAEIETYADELAKAQADIAALQTRNQELTDEIQGLNSSIETLLQQVDEQVNDLKALNQKLTSEIRELNKTIKDSLILPELQKVAKSFSQTTSSPVTFSEVSHVTTIDSSNLNDQIDDIIEATATLNIDKGTFLGVSFLKDAALPTEELNAYRDDIASIIAVGDYVVKVDWEMSDGTEFSTLALVDKYGAPKFEPILSFTPATTQVQAKDEWGWAPSSSTDHWWQKTWSQDTALGTNGVSVKIKLTIHCDDETCKIISQSLTVDFTTGLFWKADSVKKETKYTAPSATCPGGVTECKKGEVKIAWASGFKKLKVKAKDYEIDIEGTLGCNGQKEFVMHACCDGTYPGYTGQY